MESTIPRPAEGRVGPRGAGSRCPQDSARRAALADNRLLHAFDGLLLPMAKPQRSTTCVGCGEPVQAVMKQGVSSGVSRRTRHVEPVAEAALRCRFDGGPDLDSDPLETYPGDLGP
jgi:hypothetical protein